MTTTLDRGIREGLTALVDRLPVVPGKEATSVRVDEALLEVAIVMLGQLSAAFADEPIGRAARMVPGRLELNVPLTAMIALKNKLGSGSEP
ncbi:hypothetical protein ACFC1R_08840 [Kitasatospora sp. NPDC056138]|uniref:hypothetical protein n=1 Tax=Kitasatospora sp. NPDC056138 TaxID=3345724 RepID=UPI0035D875BE